jgi:hypothetical protein
LGTLFSGGKLLRAAKKPQLSFWNNFHRLSMESWALCFGGKLKTLLCVWRNNRSWSFGTKFPRVYHWRKKPVGFLTLCQASSGYTRKSWVGFSHLEFNCRFKTALTGGWHSQNAGSEFKLNLPCHRKLIILAMPKNPSGSNSQIWAHISKMSSRRGLFTLYRKFHWQNKIIPDAFPRLVPK